MAEFNVYFNAFPGFDIAYLTEICEEEHRFNPPERQAKAQVTTFLGRTAVSCEATTVFRTGIESRAFDFRVEYRPGETLWVGGYAYLPAALETVEAILNSFKLLAEQQLSPPASPR